MLKDFTKLETFLTVVREKSFSKASKKLGISQPAVTQQIKLLEDYIEDKIVDRKKNGIRLTKTGEELHKIAIKLEKAINTSEKDMIKLIDKDIAFIIGASFMIGNYILPNFFNKLQEEIKREIMLKIDDSEEITEELMDKKVDLAILEAPVFREDIIFREWLEDELFIVSKSPIPKVVKPEDLVSFRWICREENSHTRKIVQEAFDAMGIDCKSFDMKSVVTSSTAVKQMILKTEVDEIPTVSIISKHIIKDELESGELYCARIKGYKLARILYIAYLKDRKHDATIDSIVSFLMNRKRV
ncbi:LysR family transcriptional regulator [Sulfurospirillum sp. 1612]|uniref:LysR family transcriptional regulator n=1 Tax=Sulfurospirillum sp. 1612 TaxID=3094835 RepID=UPI002F94A1FC